MHAGLDINMPNYASAIVMRQDVVNALSFVQTAAIAAQ